MSRWFTKFDRRQSKVSNAQPMRRTRLSILALEDRAVPAVITVTNTADAGAGSLRQALIDVALPDKPGMDVINFSPTVTGTILLSSALSVNSDVDIQGPGANLLSISGNKLSRVFSVSDGTAGSVTVMMANLTIKDGAAISGAGIQVGQNDVVQLTSCWLTGNSATMLGGAIHVVNGGDLQIMSSTLSDNRADFGGGVAFTGAAIDGAIELRNCTISGNQAQNGGGIGLTSFAGEVMVINSTVTNNSATAGTGGGIHMFSGGGTIAIRSSIVWGNSASAATGTDISTAGLVVYSHTALGSTAGISALVNQGGNLAIGTNPQLSSLLNNGGPMPTHALLAGSPAIDQGVNPAAACLSDERGPGNTRSYGTTDIGAFEYRVAGVPTVEGSFANVASTGGSNYVFQLTYRDDGTINVANISTGLDVFVTGPNGFSAWATNVGVDIASNGSPRVATYLLTPPGGSWDGLDNGVYTVAITKNAVYDNSAKPVPAGNIGQFNVAAKADTFLVTNDADSGPGSLRAAVALANSSLGTPDTITFDPMYFNTSRTIGLTSGEMAITDALTIQGLGASLVTISGSNAGRIFNIDNGAGSSMLVAIDGVSLINGAATGPGGAIVISNENVTLSNSVFTGNRSTGGGFAPGGGAVAVTGAGSLTVSDCTFTNNKATGLGADGGAIRAADGSTLMLQRTMVSGNTANGNGGGVYQSANYAASSLSVVASALVNNSATDLLGGGGGLFFSGVAGTAVVRNSTISGNLAVAFGGGIGINGLVGNMMVQNCTITENSAGSSSRGGGVGQVGGTGQVKFESTIVSGNFNALAPDVYTTGKASFRTSALGSKAGIAGYVDLGNNLPVGVALNLGALANHGGTTPTHIPGANSPLVDRGSNPAGMATDQRGSTRADGIAVDIGSVEIVSPGLPVATAAPMANVVVAGGTTYNIIVTYADNGAVNAGTIDSNDIRVTGPNSFNVLATLIGVDAPGNGSPRTATYQFTAPGGAWNGADAGDYTVSLEPNQVQDTAANHALALVLGSFRADISTVYVVTNVNDSGPGSLRNALTLANVTTALDTITFDPGYFAVNRTIILTTGELAVVNPLSIQGAGTAQLMISGNNNSRVFNINDGSAASSAAVTISNLTISNGKSAVEGGGIYLFDEQLSLNGVAVTNNVSTSGAGGGIFVASKNATLNLTDCNVSKNSAGLGMSGGGIRIDGAASVTITRTTISGNVAALRGGGVYFNNGGSLMLLDSTISGNTAQAKDGGGLYFFGIVGADGLVVRNSTISGNVAAGHGGGVAMVSVTGNPVFQNCTIANNAAGGEGGGIARLAGTNSISLNSTIIAGNTAGVGGADLAFNAAVAIAAGHNLIGVADAGNFTLTGMNNLTGTAASPLDAMLAPLAGNFGAVKTHALLTGSPAINSGSNSAALPFDQRGPGFQRTSGATTDIGAYEVQHAPTIANVIINDGSAQRSRITSMTVQFSTLMLPSAMPASSFVLEKMAGGSAVGAVTLAVDLSPSLVGQTIAKLTFSGPLTEYESLVDGQYRLTVLAATMADASGQTLDGNGDGAMGDNYVSAAGSIYRLYGDVNGDGAVANSDFNMLRAWFGGASQAFDFDADGSVSANDFSQFRLRFGASI